MIAVITTLLGLVMSSAFATITLLVLITPSVFRSDHDIVHMDNALCDHDIIRTNNVLCDESR
jgi:hypothetical protein